MNKMLKNNILLYLLIFTAINSFSQSQTHNYIETVILKQPVTDYYSIDKTDNTQTTVNINYLDGLGRPIQTISVAQSPNGHDVVQPITYDQFSRQDKQYLPYTIENNNGGFRTDAITEQMHYYNTNRNSENRNIALSDRPFSQVQYDNSPLNIMEEQIPVGYNAGEADYESDYAINSYTIPKFSVNTEGSLVVSSVSEHHQANTLKFFREIDPDGNISWICKDSKNQTIMNITFLGTTEDYNPEISPVEPPSLYTNSSLFAITRYVYDHFGLLRFVITPEIYFDFQDGTYAKSDNRIRQYCYTFIYDQRHRLIKKRLPGAKYIKMEYDNSDLLRATQDGNLRAEGKWQYFNYDALYRQTTSGITPNFDPEQTIPDVIGSSATHDMENFYDNYVFTSSIPELAFNSTLSYHEKLDRTRGMQTGNKIKITDKATQKENLLYTVNYYDKYGRIIQTISENHKGGYDIISTKYDFIGNILEINTDHNVKDAQGILHNFNYTQKYYYDHANRLEKTEYSTNGLIYTTLYENQYNELGQVIEKNIHELSTSNFAQNVNYQYNIQGMLTNINDVDNQGTDLFSMSLHYQDAIAGNQTYKNGNISAIQWNTPNLAGTEKYFFKYDNLNRLTEANFATNGRYNVAINYDHNGNITNLNRDGQYLVNTSRVGDAPNYIPYYGLIDDLTYTYSGNQLQSVTDAVSLTISEQENDFRDNGATTTTDYLYDANGNMISDANKNITIEYNYLNLPDRIFAQEGDITYLYSPTGTKLRMQTLDKSGNILNATDYCGNFVYENDVLAYIITETGRIVVEYPEGAKNLPPLPPVNDPTSYKLINEYNLQDHLGNNRVVFQIDKGQAVVVQENHYYPFGMQMNGFTNPALTDNNYLYYDYLREQIPFQSDFGLDWYDYGARFYDAILCKTDLQKIF